MTPQEALYWCEQFEDNIVLADPQKQKMVLALQAMKECKKALQKQIQKKPLNPCGRYYGKAKGGNCPICGASTNSVTYTYCRKCGQAIDWSDTECR